MILVKAQEEQPQPQPYSTLCHTKFQELPDKHETASTELICTFLITDDNNDDNDVPEYDAMIRYGCPSRKEEEEDDHQVVEDWDQLVILTTNIVCKGYVEQSETMTKEWICSAFDDQTNFTEFVQQVQDLNITTCSHNETTELEIENVTPVVVPIYEYETWYIEFDITVCPIYNLEISRMSSSIRSTDLFDNVVPIQAVSSEDFNVTTALLQVSAIQYKTEVHDTCYESICMDTLTNIISSTGAEPSIPVTCSTINRNGDDTTAALPDTYIEYGCEEDDDHDEDDDHHHDVIRFYANQYCEATTGQPPQPRKASTYQCTAFGYNTDYYMTSFLQQVETSTLLCTNDTLPVFKYITKTRSPTTNMCDTVDEGDGSLSRSNVDTIILNEFNTTVANELYSITEFYQGCSSISSICNKAYIDDNPIEEEDEGTTTMTPLSCTTSGIATENFEEYQGYSDTYIVYGCDGENDKVTKGATKIVSDVFCKGVITKTNNNHEEEDHHASNRHGSSPPNTRDWTCSAFSYENQFLTSLWYTTSTAATTTSPTITCENGNDPVYKYYQNGYQSDTNDEKTVYISKDFNVTLAFQLYSSPSIEQSTTYYGYGGGLNQDEDQDEEGNNNGNGGDSSSSATRRRRTWNMEDRLGGYTIVILTLSTLMMILGYL